MSDGIRIVRNDAGNCVNFYGTTNPTYWNACLSGEVDPTDNTKINIINDVRTAAEGETIYEFYQMEFSEFHDAEGNAFATAQEAADYITEKANVHGNDGGGYALTSTDTLDMSRDATNTTVLFDDGSAHAVNAIQAVVAADGTITIQTQGDSQTALYTGLFHTNVYIGGNLITGTAQGVVNTLNALFSVTPLGIGGTDPEPEFPTLDGVDITETTRNAIDPVGDPIVGVPASGQWAWYTSDETIDEVGEYYTIKVTGHGRWLLGLASEDDGDFDEFNSGAITSAAAGFKWSMAFYDYGSYMGAWTLYGSNAGYIMGPGWSNSTLGYRYQTDIQADLLAGQPSLFKVGIDDMGFASCWYWRTATNEWVMVARSNYVLPAGNYKLLAKLYDSGQAPMIYETAKRVAVDPAAPTLYERWIESPDGTFVHPLYASEEEANYVDEQNGGVAGGSSHAHVFVDDNSGTTWYMPDNGGTMDGTSAPATGTEIPTLADALFAPAAFTDYTQVVDEGAAVNIQVQPQDVNYTTSVSGLPAGLLFVNGYAVFGTAPDVAGDNVATPSEDHVVTVTRTNAYGSSTGTLTIRVNNLTAPSVAPDGFTIVTGSVDGSGNLASDSVVSIDGGLEVGKRYVVPTTWADDNVLSYLDGSLDKAYFGVPATDADWSTVQIHQDFDAVIRWEWTGANAHKMQLSVNGGPDANSINVGSSSAYHNHAIEWDGTDLVVIRTNDLSDLTARSLSEIDASKKFIVASYTAQSGTLPLVFATKTGGTMNITTDGMQVIDAPAAPVSILTPWTKALDFSGSSQRAQCVVNTNTYSPLRMSGLSATVAAGSAGMTSNNSNSRPWATALVFKSDGNSSNQHIWNQGEGAGSGDDNIYVRQDSVGNMYFGWGRSGDINECRIGTGFHNSSNKWWGLYVAHNGTRLNSANATAANLAACFDIRFMHYDSGSWQIITGNMGDAAGNRSTTANWDAGTTGGRMDRTIAGEFTIGGRGSNRNYHGKVASMVVTTLQSAVAMPTDAEVEMMITDPKKWLDDYKVGNSYRRAYEGSTYPSFALNNYNAITATHVWLMGDGSSDAYAKVRNQVFASDQNYTPLNMVSMVSNDIETVSIPGLNN